MEIRRRLTLGSGMETTIQWVHKIKYGIRTISRNFTRLSTYTFTFHIMSLPVAFVASYMYPSHVNTKSPEWIVSGSQLRQQFGGGNQWGNCWHLHLSGQRQRIQGNLQLGRNPNAGTTSGPQERPNSIWETWSKRWGKKKYHPPPPYRFHIMILLLHSLLEDFFLNLTALSSMLCLSQEVINHFYRLCATPSPFPARVIAVLSGVNGTDMP